MEIIKVYAWDFVQIQLNYYDWYFGDAKEEKKKWLLWVSIATKILSFKQRPGFDAIEAAALEEYWKKVHSFLDTGYRVQ